MNDDTDFLDQFEVEKDHDRSLFLSGLCILTWVGSWFIVLYYGLHILKISDIEASIYHFEEWQTEYYLMKVGVVAPIVSSLGAVFMWRMRRFGFFVYLAGQLGLSVFGLYVYLLVKPIEAPESYYFILGFAAQLGFIPLYAMNWKTMK